MITVRPLAERDLAEADRIFRLAFGTQLALADPMTFRGDAGMVVPRWHADPEGALGAFRGEELIGSAFAARWGSFGVFGPISVRPDCWSDGVGKLLMQPAMTQFERWRTQRMGLFTFPQSAKHLALYQKFGFWPQYLTAVMSKPVQPGNAPYLLYSQIPERERDACLRECATLTGALLDGLDLQREIHSITRQQLGDTLLLREQDRLSAFAACHVGKGSEAGSGSLYVKFGAARPGAKAAETFARLLAACEALAAQRGCATLTAGTNTARHPVYRMLIDKGFRTVFQGVAMQRPNDPGINTAGHFVLDDWR